MTVAFIGAGRMAEALMARLAQKVVASDINAGRLKYLKKKYQIKAAPDNVSAFAEGDMVVLSVKPQNMREVLEEISKNTAGRKRKLVISIAAGVSLDFLQSYLGRGPIIRAMPNNPCLAGRGVTALSKGKNVKRSEFSKAKALFSAVGRVIEVPEAWMDAITGLSGSGPAFVYQTISALAEGGVAAGLPGRVALELAVQTVLGSAETVSITGKSPQELCAMVASPGGTTMEGLKSLEKYQYAEALVSAVTAAAAKSKALTLVG